METRIGQLNVKYSARGIPSYSVELWHDGLNKHRLIKGEGRAVVERKAEIQIAEWQERWEIVDAKNNERLTRLDGKRYQEQQKTNAAERTSEALSELEGLKSLLQHTLSINDTIDWETLKDKSKFPEVKPAVDAWPFEPNAPRIEAEPLASSSKYTPTFTFFEKIFKSKKNRRIAELTSLYKVDHERWATNKGEILQRYDATVRTYKAETAKLEDGLVKKIAAWEERKHEFLKKQESHNSEIDAKRASYLNRDPSSIVEYCDLVLSNSQYQDYFPKEFEIDFIEESKTLLVEYALPAPEDLPTLKGVKYIASRDEFEEQHITESQAAKIYDDALYQIVLRTIHELFEADAANALVVIVFNGIVTSTDKSTGKLVTACVLSLQANRDEFLEINLSQVDSKTCFKALKGVGSSKLHGLSAIPPIMQLRRDDGRFVSAYDVAHTLDDGVNLASMDWQDFEHLIREIFAKEFSSSGGEVKVTQASRDGGVDAVAFDPDPIRGGKIVIQAKRYTNTVNVSAVRDLYGTVLNEGATKGVLVTTSDYGPDSYAFANGKPLVLLSGANLLHMLEKHGHRARINLKEAKALALSGK